MCIRDRGVSSRPLRLEREGAVVAGGGGDDEDALVEAGRVERRVARDLRPDRRVALGDAPERAHLRGGEGGQRRGVGLAHHARVVDLAAEHDEHAEPGGVVARGHGHGVDELGRPGVNTRLMVGLLYLKHAYDESDESVAARWVENPYWPFFCGLCYMPHALPIDDPSSPRRWRKRVGAERLEKLLEATSHTALAMKAVRPQEFQQVNVDTTVQEKAIAFPTDARLYHKMRVALIRRAIEGSASVHGVRTIPKRATRAFRRMLKRRAAIEPTIGHWKSDNRMNRNYLTGPEGDKINALLSAAGYNLRKLLRWVVFAPIFWPRWWLNNMLAVKTKLRCTTIVPACV